MKSTLALLAAPLLLAWGATGLQASAKFDHDPQTDIAAVSGAGPGLHAGGWLRRSLLPSKSL